MVLKATGIVIKLTTKLLIVGDSVMGCCFQALEDGDASPSAIHKLVTALPIREKNVLSPIKLRDV
jgi:hypothetical protein